MDGPNHYDVKTGPLDRPPDSIGEKGGDPDWYGYWLDDPMNGVDPSWATQSSGWRMK